MKVRTIGFTTTIHPSIHPPASVLYLRTLKVAVNCHLVSPRCLPPSDTPRAPCPSQILESSQTLLNVLKREAINLTKKRPGM
jgi:hypothetical protein